MVTNALLENKGARAGFVATRGLRDILELRRSSRADLYDLLQDAPAVLVPRRWRFEITERIDAQGEVVTPLAEDELPALIEAIRDAELQTVAVSFLFSFLNDAHERRVGEALRAALPDVGVYLSSEVLPEIREFERASTTAVCAVVGPVLASYLDRLQSAISRLGLPKLHVMGSSGGVFDIAEGLRMPAMAVESGPAAGVIAASLAGRQLGRPNLISFDMGGTTAKASVIADGEVVGHRGIRGRRLRPRQSLDARHRSSDPRAGDRPGGGQCRRRLDRLGRSGWRAEGRAAQRGRRSRVRRLWHRRHAPTVTDADVVLGYLDREALLGGALRIDLAAAERAIDTAIARPLGLTVPEAAARIVEVVNSNMAQALRIVSIERGHDPQEFSLIAFGGAGPVHAVSLAEELQIPEVIVPPAPGAFSALGLVASDLQARLFAHAVCRSRQHRSGACRRGDCRHGAGGARDAARGAGAAGTAGAAAPGGCALSAAGVRADRADCRGRDHARHAG